MSNGDGMISGFGLAKKREEGHAIHPDDIDANMSEESYDRQLAAHMKDAANKEEVDK